MRLLQIGPISERFDRRLAQAYDVGAQAGGDIDIVVTSARCGCSGEIIRALPKLKAICVFGVGCDAVDLVAARERGVVVSNTPDVLNDCVADLALGLILDVARNISAGDRFVRSGQWQTRAPPPGRKVSGKKIGIVGLGRIGLAVAKRAAGFDMAIGYHNRRPVAGSPHVFFAAIVQLAEWADFLVVTTLGGADTRNLIGAEELQALGPKGALINIARGSVVDEAALIDALRRGALGGAGLDVHAREPLVAQALLAMENVVLLPHIGSNTVETRQAMEDLVFENIESFLARGRLKTPVG